MMNDGTHKSIEELRTKVASMERDLAEQRLENRQLRDTVERLRLENGQLRETVEALQVENRQLREQLEQARRVEARQVRPFPPRRRQHAPERLHRLHPILRRPRPPDR